MKRKENKRSENKIKSEEKRKRTEKKSEITRKKQKRVRENECIQSQHKNGRAAGTCPLCPQ